MAGEKIFAGSRIRDLRNRNGQSQQGLATALGLSASYLNQIENDQRPLTPGILLKLCTMFGVEPTWFSDSGDVQRMQVLREILGDPLFSTMPYPRQLQEAVRGAPWLCDQFVTLYRAFRALREERGPGGAAPPAPPPGPRGDASGGGGGAAGRNYLVAN
ncbi:MAG: helix-turn-helix transcriptional regulator, partial [Gluconacetobacter sp.]